MLPSAWSSTVIGARHGEVTVMEWDDIDLTSGILGLDETYVRTADGMILKDTKTYQMRHIAIDEPTVELRTYKGDCTQALSTYVMIQTCAILACGRYETLDDGQGVRRRQARLVNRRTRTPR